MEKNRKLTFVKVLKFNVFMFFMVVAFGCVTQGNKKNGIIDGGSLETSISPKSPTASDSTPTGAETESSGSETEDQAPQQTATQPQDKTETTTPADPNSPTTDAPETLPFLLGIERIDEYASTFADKRVGLITNATGIDQVGCSSIDILFEKVKLVALFSPEHGIRGSETAGANIAHTTDKKTGLPVYSLYGNTKRPTADMLRNIDVLCFDIQDVGARFYTYIWTLCYAMESCAEHGVEVVVFDRPNPIGNTVEGAILQLDYRSFVGYLPIAQRHGMTVGELANMFQKEFKIKTKLTVIPMQAYDPTKYFDDYPLMWIPTSPNIPHPATATVYSGLCLFEGVNLSVGRGTTMPFEYIGAPYIDAQSFADKLNALELEGVFFYPAYFTPTDSNYKGTACQGVQIIVTDKNAFKSVKTTVMMFDILKKDYATKFKITNQGYKLASINLLSGTSWFTANDFSATKILERMESDTARFENLRKPYLLY